MTRRLIWWVAWSSSWRSIDFGRLWSPIIVPATNYYIHLVFRNINTVGTRSEIPMQNCLLFPECESEINTSTSTSLRQSWESTLTFHLPTASWVISYDDFVSGRWSFSRQRNPRQSWCGFPSWTESRELEFFKNFCAPLIKTFSEDVFWNHNFCGFLKIIAGCEEGIRHY